MPMRTMLVIETLPAQEAAKGPIEYIRLDWGERVKHRQKCRTEEGTELALALERGTVLADGDILYNTQELTVVVSALPQQLIIIRPKDVYEACRIAHQLGNWHRSVQLLEDGTILLEDDDPIRNWLQQQGFSFAFENRPYHPNVRVHAH
jgi:urease accessory protein